MIDDIKSLWGMMTPETKQSVEKEVFEEFDVNSVMYFRQHWLYKEKMPEDYQERIHEIFQNAMLIQHKKTGKLLGA